MYSISFPNMFSSVRTNLVKDKEATASNLWLLLNSDKLTLFGDPYFGTALRKAIFEQNNSILVDMVIDEILVAIQTFMPQVITKRNDISITADDDNIYAHIKCTDLTDYSTNLFDVNLTSNIGDVNSIG